MTADILGLMGAALGPIDVAERGPCPPRPVVRADVLLSINLSPSPMEIRLDPAAERFHSSGLERV